MMSVADPTFHAPAHQAYTIEYVILLVYCTGLADDDQAFTEDDDRKSTEQSVE